MPLPFSIRTMMLVALATACAALALPATGLASTTIDILGTWNAQGQGGGPYTIDFTGEDCATGVISGTASAGIGPENGTLAGDQITLDEYYGGYHSHVTATVTATTMTGQFSDSNGTTAPWNATRQSGPPDPPPAGCSGGGTTTTTTTSTTTTTPTTTTTTTTTPTTSTTTSTTKRASGTSVTCNLFVATATDTCIAQVGDVGPPSPVTPTGPVSFHSDNGGVFAAGSSCALAQTPLSPGVASCSVTFIPPAGGGFPQVGATYAGDTQHTASSGHTQFIIAAIPQDESATCGGPQPSAVRAHLPIAVGTRSSDYDKRIATCLAAASGLSGGLLGAASFLAPLACEAASEGAATPLCILIQRVLAGGAAALGIDAGGFSVIAADPPRADYRRLTQPRVGDLHLPRPHGPFAALERRIESVISLHARLKVTMAAMSLSRDRASGARAAHNRQWERRQMLANAGFARAAASINAGLKRQSAALGTALRRTRLGRTAVSQKQARSLLAGIAAHGLPKALAKSLRAGGLGAAELRRATQSLLNAAPAQVARTVAGSLAGPALLTAYGHYASWLRAYAKRVSANPVATQV